MTGRIRNIFVYQFITKSRNPIAGARRHGAVGLHAKIDGPFQVFPEVIQLSVNGQPRRLGANARLSELLESLELVGKRVAVEKNGEIVPRSRYADTALAEGDRLEIVVAVGGG
jgi:sulfur carrier protein